MADFYLSTDTIQSFLSNGNSLEPILQTASETLKNRGRVIIQNEFVNAPPEIERILSTLEELEDWKLEIDPPMDFFLFTGTTEICPVTNMNVTGGERTYQRMAVIGGKTIAIPSRPSPLVVTFTCNTIIPANGNYCLSNKHRLIIQIVVQSVNNNVVTALVSQ
jgi:hypothetical protein